MHVPICQMENKEIKTKQNDKGGSCDRFAIETILDLSFWVHTRNTALVYDKSDKMKY